MRIVVLGTGCMQQVGSGQEVRSGAGLLFGVKVLVVGFRVHTSGRACDLFMYVVL